MTAFPKPGRIAAAFAFILLVLGGSAILTAVAAPYIGLGLKEEFFLYRLAEWSRSDLFRMGIFSGLAGLALAVPSLMRLINRWPWTADKSRRLQAYFALPPAAAPYSFNRRDQKILLAAAALFQAIYLFIIPLNVECDAAMYFSYAKYILGIEGGVYTHYRPPGFPVFLIATGQMLFDSFIGTVIAHAAMGIVMPVLVYRSFAPMNRRAAFICAAVFILSTMPFIGAKLMFAEQLYTFLMIGMIYGFSRYYFSRDPRFIYLVIFLGLAMMFTRWGGVALILLTAIMLVIVTRKETDHLRHLILALSVVVATTGYYSFWRSYVLNEPALFGSLHNMTSLQMFWRVDHDLTRPAMEWTHLLGLPIPDDEHLLREYRDKFTWGIERDSALDASYEKVAALKLVDPANGPATRRLRDLIVTVATENPEAYRRLKPMIDRAYQPPNRPRVDYYHENFGRFEGDAESMAENFFNHPSSFYASYIFSELNLKLGITQTDTLFRDVAMEAISSHPIVLLTIVAQGMEFLGVDFKALVGQLRGTSSELPVMAIWGKFHYSTGGIDTTGCVASAFPPEMQVENLQDNLITSPLTESALFTAGKIMLNLVRNTVGVIALLTWWFIPFSRHRVYLIFIAACALALIGGAAVAASGGSGSRYEIFILPLILMTTTGAILALREFFQKLGAKSQNALKP
ncbi:MAG: hypothetical protein ISR48_00475 [Alphaproteobacteria bacterium]|nr:hypothetical protein [Alphaproteobacteria bacterium]